MEKLTFMGFCIFVLCTMGGVCSNAQDEESTTSAPMMKTEQDALYSAVQGFAGKWWNGSDLYPDPCGWTPIQGVSCDLYDGLWYVTELNIGPLHDNSITCAQEVEFNPHVFALRHLKSLSFFNCFVSPRHRPVSIPSKNWEVFKDSLESLEFRSNPALTGKIPDSLGELKNLKSLVIMQNGLTGELPETLGNLTNLKRLDISGNSLNGSIPYSFGGLNGLLILDVSRNSLSGALPPSIGSMTSLLKLDLSNNHLQAYIPQEIGKLKSLTLLDLSNNGLSQGLGKSFENMAKLQEMILANNPIGGDMMSVEWEKLRELSALDLANTSLTGGIPASIVELKALRFLGLNDNKLTGCVPDKISELPNVSALYVHGNNLSGELRFSEWFYGKMGRRFGAWDNPNLCYSAGLASNVPFGVKRCEEETVVRYEDFDFSRKYSNLDDHVISVASKCCLFSVSYVSLLVVLLVFLIMNSRN